LNTKHNGDAETYDAGNKLILLQLPESSSLVVWRSQKIVGWVMGRKNFFTLKDKLIPNRYKSNSDKQTYITKQ